MLALQALINAYFSQSEAIKRLLMSVRRVLAGIYFDIYVTGCIQGELLAMQVAQLWLPHVSLDICLTNGFQPRRQV
jgi:hypothetical protein